MILPDDLRPRNKFVWNYGSRRSVRKFTHEDGPDTIDAFGRLATVKFLWAQVGDWPRRQDTFRDVHRSADLRFSPGSADRRIRLQRCISRWQIFPASGEPEKTGTMVGPIISAFDPNPIENRHGPREADLNSGAEFAE